MNHVEAVRTFLEQQTVRVTPLRVPVFEVVVPTVAYEVPAPNRARLADRALIDELLEQLYHRLG